jgi:hypothetical protein
MVICHAISYMEIILPLTLARPAWSDLFSTVGAVHLRFPISNPPETDTVCHRLEKVKHGKKKSFANAQG